jgi:hypothetical protein
MGISPDLSGIDYLHAGEKLAAYKPVPVQQVEGGPIFENQMAEHEVDLTNFPLQSGMTSTAGPIWEPVAV